MMTTKTFQRPLCIINPVSGNGSAHSRFLKEYLDLSSEYPNTSFYITCKQGDLQGIKSAINDHEPDLLVVYGGDGTLNDVINGSDAEIPVALVPAGSGNDFAALIGIEKKSSITERLKKTNTEAYDVGDCNGRLFMNGLGIGFDGEIARQTVSNKSSLPNFLKYYLAIFRSIFFYKESRSEIEWDESGKAEGEYLMITVANGRRYGGSFKVAPISSANDGLLDLVLIRKVHPLLRPVYLPLVVIGKHLKLSFVQHHQVRSVRISANHILPAHTDGELMLSNTYDVHFKTKKLHFLL